MGVWFYDNQETPYLQNPIYTVVERVYCFDFHQFIDAHWSLLDNVYHSLPQWQGYQDNIPYWFGIEDDLPPNLSASVEPPGLQVYGQLLISEWLDWDERFRERAAILPVYSL